VILTVTADPIGGTPGKLFCQLSTGKTALASTTARTLTSVATAAASPRKGSPSAHRLANCSRPGPALARLSIFYSGRYTSTSSV
jgi:hypothetical protein